MENVRHINGQKVLNVLINEWEGGENFGNALIEIGETTAKDGAQAKILTTRNESEALLFDKEAKYRPFWFNMYTQDDKVFYVLYESVLD